mmetsp:Transcript_9399/g.16667  ORF Transcript_9399/g.16667 Transcript_9399/m.16667 type:complete len:310 (-) Transcript_9399:294-1223(-)
MHRPALQRLLVFSVRIRSKSSKTLVVDVHFQWVIREDNYIDPHVELAATNEQWIWDIALNDPLLLGKFLRLFLRNVRAQYLNTATAALTAWLPDPECIGLALSCCIPGLESLGKDVALRRDLVLLSKLLLHLSNCSPNQILAPQVEGPREVVGSLHRTEAPQLFRGWMQRPHHSPAISFCSDPEKASMPQDVDHCVVLVNCICVAVEHAWTIVIGWDSAIQWSLHGSTCRGVGEKNYRRSTFEDRPQQRDLARFWTRRHLAFLAICRFCRTRRWASRFHGPPRLRRFKVIIRRWSPLHDIFHVIHANVS